MVPLSDIFWGDFEVKVSGSKIFLTLWKAWCQVKPLLCSRTVVGKNLSYTILDRSIWWGVYLNDKPLALTQCCLAKI